MAKVPSSNAPRRAKAQQLAHRKRKTGTATTKNHRFESFGQRISKLNVDPIRRGDAKHRVHDENETSHFISALDTWKDTNLSENFTDFVRKVDPLCQNLPQIVHYESDILELLFAYVEKADALCLEPLLNLITHLAHDLGSRFEGHFERAVSIVSRLAAQHESVEVIEWSFTCLAWLFKYLSRLLVPDLRPLYDLMAPLLGKQHHKSFVSKFSAESMSFLVRKAGAQYHSNRAPLDTIIAHAFHDLSQTADNTKMQYQQGLTVLFSESIKGVQRGPHTGGMAIVGALISYLMSASTETAEFSQDMQLVVESVIIDTIHYMDSKGFAPILEVVLENSSLPIATESNVIVFTRLLLVIIATRKGSRIEAWPAIAKRIIDNIDWINSKNETCTSQLQVSTLDALAAALQYAPFDVALPLSQNAMRRIDNELWTPHFLYFCTFFSGFGKERFETLVMPEFQKFIVSRWKTYERELCYILPNMNQRGNFTKSNARLPHDWQDHIQTTLRRLHDPSNITSDSDLLPTCHVYVRLLESINNDSEFSQRISGDLLVLTRSVLMDNSEVQAGPLEVFALCRGLPFAVKSFGPKSIAEVERSRILQSTKTFGRRPSFLRVLLHIVTVSQGMLERETSDVTSVIEPLLENLTSPSHELRTLSLSVFAGLYSAISEDVPQALIIAQDVESSPFTVESARAVSLKIRKLAPASEDTSDPWLKTALIAHCFGLFHVGLTPIWEDVRSALRTMADTSDSEALIMDRAVLWLKDAASSDVTQQMVSALQDPTAELAGLPGFQCTNLSHVDEIALKSSQEVFSGRNLLQDVNNIDLEAIPTSSRENRAQGLRVLSAMPQLAEKRSRSLVPILLDWVTSLNLMSPQGEGTETDSETLGSHGSPPRYDQNRWSRKDQKALLALFGQFINPSVLFRSKDVHSALLELLCNGDVDIQTSALKALFTWKSPALTPYRENLFNILDDARFRDEVTTFLDNEDGSTIRQEHRSGLMPILLRLLYGRVTTRVGLGNARGSQEARRKAVLTSLSRFGQEAVEEFAAIALGPLKTLPSLFSDSGDFQEEALDKNLMSLRRQTGMLRMLRDMLSTLPDQMKSSSRLIADAVIYCLVKSTRPQSSASGEDVHQDVSLSKSIRQEAYACVILLYAKYPQGEWMNQIEKPLFDSVINSKLENLAVETAQAPSSLLKLFSAWSASAYTNRLLFEPNRDLMAKVADCLIEPSAKLEVKRFVLKEIIKPFTENVINADDGVADSYLRDGVAHIFFTRIAEILRQTHEKDCVEACVEIFINLQPFVSRFQETRDVIDAALRFLSLPSKTISPRLKGQILELLQHFLPKHDFGHDQELYDLSVRSISKLFGFFQDAQNRSRLVNLLDELANFDHSLQQSALLCRQLNSYSHSRLSEPNYGDREAAFQILNDDMWTKFGAQQWLPVIHNLLFLVRDKDELSTRTSASVALRRFIQATASVDTKTDATGTTFLEMLKQTVIPAVQAGMLEESELVRNEYISVLAEMVRNNIDSMQDLKVLLSTDDESSFFNNILHIQPHRRNRALQRLSAESAKLSSLNIGRFFIPLMETIIADKAAEAHNLATEAVNTLEYLAQGLEWNRYRALVQRMVQDPQRFNTKLRIRALGSLLTGLHHTHLRRQASNGIAVEQDKNNRSNFDTSDSLLNSLPDEAALQKSLFNSVFSKLLDQIHYQDEASLDIRILVAIYAIKLVLVFPASEINHHLPAVLVDMCNVLKSRAQEARDSTRKTLADIAAIIGPAYFGFIVKQLRSSLKRGYQLHVLSYTVHSLLLSASTMFKVGSLDYCLPDLVAVIMDDAFGVTGQEKEAKGYVSSMREVKKKALGFDSMEILATMITLPRVSVFLKPIGMHLDKPRPKIEKADELFRRIREGLRRNENAKSRDVLTLCFELMTEALHGKGPSQEITLRTRKMIAFALEVLRRILDKHEELKTSQNLSGFLPLFDTVAAQSDEEIQMSLFRLLASVIKVPLKELDDYAANFVHRAKETIENAISTNEPLAQAALRLISAILRERPAAMLEKTNFERDIAFLLKKITPDLQEPARQGERDRQVAAFNFLKAIMARGIVIKEVYDTMDTVREVMITSQDVPIPDLARGVYSRFILDYFPGEGKGMARQLDFLTTNLQYEHARGRKSVMEVIAVVLNKMDNSSVQPVLVSIFLPLVLVLVVDQNEDCRAGAELLLRKTFERADKDQVKLFKSQMMKWQRADANTLWKKVALRVWGIFFEIHPTANKEALAVHENASDIIQTASDDEADDEAATRPLLLASLELFKSFCILFPSIAFAANSSETWSAIKSHLASEEPKVRATAAQLISIYFADFARTFSKPSKELQVPLVGSHGLELTSQTLHPIAKASMRLLSSDANEPAASETTIQNLAFIGRVARNADADGQGILDTLFQQSSAILRAETDVSRPPRAKLASLDLVAALCDFVPVEALAPSLHGVLLPLHHLTDAVIAAPTSADPEFGDVHERLVSRAREVMDQIREKVGAVAFMAEMGRVQKVVRDRREGRRAKRAVEAVAEPEKVAREKRKKRENEKEKRRVRNQHAAGMRRGW